MLILATCGLSACSAIGPNTEIVRLETGRDVERASRLTQEGVHFMQNGRQSKAKTAFERAVSADETHGPAHNNLGLLSFGQRDLYSAAWSFQRAMEFLPERAEPTNNLGLTYEAAARLDEAIAMYYTAHELDPTNSEYLGNLTRARIRRGDRDDLLRHELQQLLFIDARPEWIDWAEDQLALVLEKQRQESDQNSDGDPGDEAAESLPSPLGTSWSISDAGDGEREIRVPYPVINPPDESPP